MMINKTGLLTALILTLTITLNSSAIAQDKPNILWLVTEDMSPYLSCYGNKLIKTPNLDKLASQGIRFTKAHSNGTQCSPSRSTLISGKYAISLGTDIHREKRPFNDSFYFPVYLRQAGYYCTNNPKEDYNNQVTPANVWNQSNNKAHYINRPDKKQPFFAQFNQGITHMTRVATRTTAGRGKRSVDMKDVQVPAYIPDLPEVRDDISWNQDAVVMMDKWVGQKLEELKANGESENTIIFFFSDHGGTVPRGKAYVYETGTLIPLIVYIPPKWKHLAAMPQPSVTDRLVSFVDFGPTVLSMADVPVPSFMVGKPFFTDAGKKKENINNTILTFTANQGPSFIPSRSITDGKFHLIWNFQSAYPNGTRQDYQWQMPAQQAWDKAYMEGKLTTGLHKKFWLPVSAFELYDVRTDSLETKDLSKNPAYANDFNRLKKLLENELHQQKDVGLIPPQYRHVLQRQGDLFSVVRKNNIDMDEVINAAAIASLKDKTNLKILTAYLSNRNPIIQYWGASGLCGLAKAGTITTLPKEAEQLFLAAGTIEEAKCMIAEAMIYTNDKDGLNFLIDEVKKGFNPAVAALQNVGKLALPVADKVKALLADKKGGSKFYLRSILINCGMLPYDDLYKLEAGEKIES